MTSIDGEGQVVQRDTNWGRGPDRHCDTIDGPEITLIPMYNMLNTPTVVFRRACYEGLGGFSDGAGFAFDYEYWMRIAVYHKVAFLAKPLIQWRIHAGAATSMYLGKNHVQKLRQVISAKRLLLAKRSHATPAVVRSQMLEQLRSVSLTSVEQLLEHTGAESEARSLLWEMRRADFGFLWDRAVWKAWLKTVLSRESIDWLKRAFSF